MKVIDTMNPGNIVDLVGQKFGRWEVLERAESLSGNARWLCRCECGTEKIVLGKNLRNGRSKSCGCLKKENDSKHLSELNKSRALDLRGQKYGMLTPIEPTNKRLSSSIVWKCRCDCGNITYVSVDNLRGAHPTKSCGCLHRSFGEQEIDRILTDNNISFSTQFIFDDLPNKRFDFYLPYNNRLIEFDGEQHFKQVGNWKDLDDQQKRDQEKNEYAKSHNIPLVRIPYWERDHITLDMLMGDKYLI